MPFIAPTENASDVGGAPHATGRRPRWRRWLWWATGAFAAVGLLLLVASGPAFPLVGKWLLQRAAASQGIEGDFRLSGSLWGKVSLLDMSLEGSERSSGFDSITLQEATAEFSPLPLILAFDEFKWLEAIRIHNASLVVVLPEDGEERETSPPADQKTPRAPSEFSTLWNLLDADVELKEISLEVLQGETAYEVEAFNLLLNRSGGSKLSIGKLGLPTREEPMGLSTDIEFGEREVTLRNLEVGGTAAIPFFTVAEPEPGNFLVAGELEIAGGVLAARMHSRGEAEVRLRNQTEIDLSKLPLDPNSELALAGKITDLGLSFLGALEDPTTWQLGGSVVGSGIAWESHQIETLAVSLRDERLSLEALRPDARLVASVRYPYRSARNLERLEELSFFAEATLEVPSIQGLIGNLSGENDWHGSIRADLKEMEILGGKELKNGRLLLSTENLRWKNEVISNFQAAAVVGQDQTVVIAAQGALDTQTQFDLDGKIDLSAQSYEGSADVEVVVNGRLLEIFSEYGIPIRGGSAQLNWKGSGDIKSNRHAGNSSASLIDLQYFEGVPFSLSTRVDYESGSFSMPEMTLTSAPLNATASAEWDGETIRIASGRFLQEDSVRGNFSATVPFQPSSENPALESDEPLKLNLYLEKLQLAPLSTLFVDSPPVSGELNGTILAEGSFRSFSSKGDLTLSPEPHSDSSREIEIGAPPPNSDLTDSELDLDYVFEGELSNPSSWKVDLLADLSGLIWRGKPIETLSLSAKTENSAPEKLLKAQLKGAASASTLSGNASIDLSNTSTFSELSNPPIQLDFDLQVPDLAGPWRDFAPPQWQGVPIAGALTLQIEDGVWNRKTVSSGKLKILSESLRILDEPIEKISIKGEVTRPNLIDVATNLRADGASHLHGTGQLELEEQTYTMELEASVDVESEGVLKRLLSGRHIASLLPARTKASVSAKGNLAKKTVSGSYKVNANTLTLAAEAAPIEKIDSHGNFSENSLLASFDLHSAPLSLEGDIDWKQDMLHLRDWKGRSGEREVFSLGGSVPLAPGESTPKDWFASNTPIDVQGEIDSLPLSALYRLIGEPSPIQGEVSLNLNTSGTPSDPSIDLVLALGKLQVTGENVITAGEIDLKLIAKDEQAKLEGAYRHPDVNPLRIEAQMPFRPAAWVTNKGSLLEERISLAADMERNSLSFLATQVPAIDSIAGTIALDVELDGKLAAPEISGEGAINVDRLRLQQPGAPSFYDIELGISFSKNEIRADRFSAIIAGGVVEAGGAVRFLPDSDPVLDFRLQGKEILLFRTPDLSLRTDANLQLEGPFSQAAIRGDFGLVNSRFFKNFDLLPTSISLPDPSSLPSIEQGPRGGGAAYSDLNLGIQVEPFSNWKTDLRIYTKDPFQVRSNLIESSLVADVRVGGTLQRPAPVGFVEIEDGSLSLPFSTVDVDTGRIIFDEITGFNGAIELKARAKANQYRINAYLYNRMLAPKYVLTSVPPLPPEDILTLVATGTTRDELTGGDPGALAASKAATLLFKNLRKADTNLNREPNLIDELNERTELAIGGINPETGAETIGGKIRLWKQLFFVGNVDAQNDYRAVLKYVFRFR